LAAMVAGISRGKRAYAAFDAELSAALTRLGVLREALKAAIDADSESYQALVTAYKEQKSTTPEQVPKAAEAVAAALRGATSVPLGVAECSAEVSALIAALRTKTNPKAASDLIVAAGLARAATEGALANVEINLESFEPGMETAFVAETRELAAKLRK